MGSWASNAVPNQTPLRSGQVWKTRNGSVDRSAFLIGDIRSTKCETRVYGALITGVDGSGSHERDLDARSMRKMFPVLAFDPAMAAPDSDSDK